MDLILFTIVYVHLFWKDDSLPSVVVTAQKIQIWEREGDVQLATSNTNAEIYVGKDLMQIQDTWRENWDQKWRRFNWWQKEDTVSL